MAPARAYALCSPAVRARRFFMQKYPETAMNGMSAHTASASSHEYTKPVRMPATNCDTLWMICANLSPMASRYRMADSATAVDSSPALCVSKKPMSCDSTLLRYAARNRTAMRSATNVKHMTCIVHAASVATPTMRK